MVTALLISVFAGVVALVVVGYHLVNRRWLATREAARSRLVSDQDGPSAAVLIRSEEPASTVPLLNRILARQQITPRLAGRLRRAGLSGLTPGAFVLLFGVCALLFGLVGAAAIGFVGATIGAAIGAYIPWTALAWAERRRIDQFDEQLPAAIDMLVSALRTGYSFHVASNFLGQELAPPLGPEFARIYDEQRLGIDPETALLGMQERIGSVEMRMFVTALLIQRKTGGNLGEVLTNTADLMRERMDVKRQLDTLTAEAKWSGRLLTFLPVVTYFGLSFIAPDFMQNFTDSVTGKYLLGLSAACVLTGYFIMMKIAQVDF